MPARSLALTRLRATLFLGMNLCWAHAAWANCLAKCVDVGHPRLPKSYESCSWIPQKYQVSPGQLGAFWTEQKCYPLMAYPSKLDVTNGTLDGVVFAGISQAINPEPAFADNVSWNDVHWTDFVGTQTDATVVDSRAACLVSIRCATSPEQPSEVKELPYPTVANFYVHWCSAGGCNTRFSTSGSNDHWPPDGLGLAQSDDLETLSVKAPILSVSPNTIERLSFDRGVLYANHLTTGSPSAIPAVPHCVPGNAPPSDFTQIPYFDPTSGPPLWAAPPPCMDVRDATDPTDIPPDLRLVPGGLDQELKKAGSSTLEGMPHGLLAETGVLPGKLTDGRRGELRPEYLLANRAVVRAVAPDSHSDDTWRLVPETIAFWNQHLHFVAVGDRKQVESFVPHDRVSPFVADLPGTPVIVSQSFELQLEDRRVVESVVTLDAAGNPFLGAATTFDKGKTYGTRWASNGGTADCFATTAFGEVLDPFQRFAFPFATGARNEVAASFCPNELAGWLERTQMPYRDPGSDLCKAAELAKGSDTLKSIVLTATAQCTGGSKGDASVAPPCDPISPATCPANSGATVVGDLIARSADAGSCIANAVIPQIASNLPNSIHWVDLNDGPSLTMVPLVGMMRNDDLKDLPARPGTFGLYQESTAGRLLSRMTTDDDFVEGAHQTMDWNWVAEADTPEAIDPAYRGLATRQGRFIGIENELEFGIPMGQRLGHVQLPADTDYNDHGRVPLSVFLQSQDNAQGLGEIWPTDFCTEFGINRSKHGEFIGRPYETNGPSVPTWVCGESDDSKPGAGVGCGWLKEFDFASPVPRTLPLGDDNRLRPVQCQSWREHLGRGLFAPINDLTTGAGQLDIEASGNQSQMQTHSDNPVSLGLQDWGECPHRLALLGRPIVDCGHGDNSCEPGNRVEIHPPHVVSMELATATSSPDCRSLTPCDDWPSDDGCLRGTVQAVFGWANVFVGSQLEFDLWPPPRPSPNSHLCVLGHDHDVTAEPAPPSGAPDAFVRNLGYYVQRQDPLCAQEGVSPACPGPVQPYSPTLTCLQVPAAAPNHVHCVYDDPNGRNRASALTPDSKIEYKSGPDDPGWTYGNPRMSPAWMVSRFEARVFIGWYEGAKPELCKSCKDGEPCQLQ